MSLLIYSDTVNPGTYGYCPSVTGQIYLLLNNLGNQSATVNIILSDNGTNTNLGNVTIGPNSSYQSDPFEVTDSFMVNIQSSKSLQLMLYSYFPDFVESNYTVDDNFIEPVSPSTSATGSSSTSTQTGTINALLGSLQTQIGNLNTQYQSLLAQYSNVSNSLLSNTAISNSLNSEFTTLSSNFTNIANQINTVAITQNIAIIQGSNSVFKSIASQSTTNEDTVSDPITLQGPNGGTLSYVIIKNSIYQKLIFSFNNYVNNSTAPMTVNFPYPYTYNPFVNDTAFIPFTSDVNSISFEGSSNTVNGVLIVEGFISDTLNNNTYYEVNGESSGSINIYYLTNGSSTKYMMMFNQYMNDTSNNQVITLPVGFSNSALINTTMELEMTVSTNQLTIVSPNSTTLYTGMVILEGI